MSLDSLNDTTYCHANSGYVSREIEFPLSNNTDLCTAILELVDFFNFPKKEP